MRYQMRSQEVRKCTFIIAAIFNGWVTLKECSVFEKSYSKCFFQNLVPG